MVAKRIRSAEYKEFKKHYMREYARKHYEIDPEPYKRKSCMSYQRLKQKIAPEILIPRWRKAAAGLLSDGDVPTPKDLKIIGILAYTMNITSNDLMKFLAGLRPSIRALKQIKQWLDFREQIILEHELPEEIRERHRIVNANYDRIVDELNQYEVLSGTDHA